MSIREAPNQWGAIPSSHLPEEDGASRCVAGSGYREAQVDASAVTDLTCRFAADLPNRFDDVPEAMDVRLAQVSAAGVDRQPAVGPLDVAIGHEVIELTRFAEAHLGDRHQHRPGEVLVELGNGDVVRTDAGARPQHATHVPVMRGRKVPFIERARPVPMLEAVRAGDDRNRWLPKVPCPLPGGNN